MPFIPAITSHLARVLRVFVLPCWEWALDSQSLGWALDSQSSPWRPKATPGRFRQMG